jgi:glucose/arabinose dehydrogenase
MTMRSLLILTLSAAMAFIAPSAVDAGPPDGFEVDPWPGDWREIVGIAPVGDGRFIAWERGGLAWMVGPDGIASTEPLIDLTEEVGAWRDHGMLGLAIDPDFAENGYVYLLYVVDRHHLLFAGTDQYDPEADEYNAATIGRVTRYTATEESDRSVVDPASRTILIGESISTGLPIVHQSHGVGSLAFGRDGTLLCSMGESSSYAQIDTGGQVLGGWVTMALADGIIAEHENVGSYRAQLVDCLAGKVLRIDPATGDGVPSNPWFDAAAPRSARSRVWSIGLRNPFRIAVVPGTGSVDPNAGQPGTIIYGDVGSGFREEFGTIDGPARNFGWPLYEGLDPNAGFWSTNTVHPDVANPLADGDCPADVRFRDLLVQECETPSNPCDPAWAEASDWEGATFASNSGGWTGDGYFNLNEIDEWIEFIVDVPDRRTRRYGLRYANGGTNPVPVDLLVDGKRRTTLQAEPSGDWKVWRKVFTDLSLTPGVHVIRVAATVNAGLLVDRLDTPDLPFTVLDSSVCFTHVRPTIDWKHASSQTRVPTLDANGSATVALVGTPDAPIAGEAFAGNCASGCVSFQDPRWPAEWRGHFFSDYIYGWIRLLRLDDQGTPIAVESFYTGAGAITALTHDPHSGAMLAIRWNNGPIRITPPPPPASEDLNGDGVVDGGDLGLLLANWNGSGIGDLDDDGLVSGSDLGLMLAAFDAPLTPCLGDLDGSRQVDAGDLGLLLGLWDTEGPGDLDGSGRTDSGDLGLLLGAWGPCDP